MRVTQLSLFDGTQVNEGAKVIAMPAAADTQHKSVPAAADTQHTPGTQVSSVSWSTLSDLDEVASRQGLSDLFIDADLAWCRKCPMAEICDKVTCQWDEDEDDFLL